MVTFLVTLGFVGSAMSLMAVGVILSNRRLHGSCGGSGDDCVCEIEKRRACHAKNQMLASAAKRRAGRAEIQAILAGQSAPPQQSAEA
jgi:hypothetical protein